MPITCFYITKLITSAKIITGSLDQNLILYDLNRKKKIIGFKVPSPVFSVLMNTVETILFAGCKDGFIYAIHLKSPKLDASFGLIAADKETVYKGNKSQVNSLALSTDENTLISGDEEGKIIVWDVTSRQSLRVIEQVKGPVTNLFCMLKSSNFMSSTAKNDRLVPISHFKRTVENSTIDTTVTFRTETETDQPIDSNQTENGIDYKEKYEKLLDKYEKFKALYEDFYEAASKKL